MRWHSKDALVTVGGGEAPKTTTFPTTVVACRQTIQPDGMLPNSDPPRTRSPENNRLATKSTLQRAFERVARGYLTLFNKPMQPTSIKRAKVLGSGTASA